MKLTKHDLTRHMGGTGGAGLTLEQLAPRLEVPWLMCHHGYAAAVRRLCTSVLSLLRRRPGGPIL